MKTKKVLFTFAVILAFASAYANGPKKDTPVNADPSTSPSTSLGMTLPSVTPNDEVKQCGVTNDQIIAYEARIGHTVHSITDIPGTCNSSCACECGGTSIVYVQNGIVVGHADSGFNCSNN